MRTALLLAIFGALTLAVLGSAASGPTYNRDVAPILDAKCASCHRLGGIAPFSLTTAADAKAHADGIVRMTKAGLMPPWMPGDDSVSIIGRECRNRREKQRRAECHSTHCANLRIRCAFIRQKWKSVAPASRKTMDAGRASLRPFGVRCETSPSQPHKTKCQLVYFTPIGLPVGIGLNVAFWI